MERMFFFVEENNTGWYEVKDPKEVKQRVTLWNSRRSYLFVMAKKISDEGMFASNPQQSDYQNISWQQRPEEHSGPTQRSIVTRMGDRITDVMRRFAILFKETGVSNEHFFKRITNYLITFLK